MRRAPKPRARAPRRRPLRARRASRALDRKRHALAKERAIRALVDWTEDVIADEPPLTVDEERLGGPGHAVAIGDRAAGIADDGIRHAVVLDELAAFRDRVPVVDADEDDAVLAVPHVRLLERRRLAFAREAVRLEEVDDDGLSAQRLQRQPPVTAQSQCRELGRRPADLRRMRLMRQPPDEQREHPGNRRERDDLSRELQRPHQAATMYTGVPTLT